MKLSNSKILFVALVLALSVFTIVGCSDNVKDSDSELYSSIKQQVEGGSISSMTNEELALLLDQIREAKSNSHVSLNESFGVLETEVQFEFERRYQDIYNNKMIEAGENTDLFNAWKKSWKDNLVKEQENNQLFSDYFYNTFIQKLDE